MTAPSSRLIVAIAALASAVAFLDGTVVNVALPAMSDELGGGLATQQWTVDAYLLTLSSLILFAGSVSDAYGRVLVLKIGLIGFGVASITVGLAPDPVTLIIARALQGAAGAFLVPSSLALLTSLLQGTAQSKAIGQWTAWTTGATLAGPLIGGVFVDTLSWRYAFLVNVIPIAATFVLLARMEGTDHRSPTPASTSSAPPSARSASAPSAASAAASPPRRTTPSPASPGSSSSLSSPRS